MMKFVVAIWHWLTTSRYTRLLEAELERVRAEHESLKRDNHALMCQLYPQLAKVRREAATGEPEVRRSFNWAVR